MNLCAKLTIALVMTCVMGSAQALEPNNDFGSATVLPPGVMTVSDSIDGVGGSDTGPDLVMGAFDEFGALLVTDDDSSNLGDGFAPGLFDLAVNADGSIELAISGFDDFDFDGLLDSDGVTPHTETGELELFIDVFDTLGANISSFSIPDFINGGDVLTYSEFDAAWAGGTFNAEVDNTQFSGGGGADPLDFWVFTGLAPGAIFSAEVTVGDFDPILGWFDDIGSLIMSDDDSGVGLLPLLNVIASPAGEVVLAVSGFDDFGFEGLHTEVGDYTLELSAVSAVPVPAAVWLFASGLVGLGAISRRSGRSAKSGV